MNENIKAEIRKLREESKIAYVASINAEGFPQVKAMMVLEHESLATHYFSTNTSSNRVSQFRNNPKASVYYCNEAAFKGALFTGTVEVLTDHATKARFWSDGCEIYYPKGVDDEDYCIYRFTADTVNYYHNLSNATLDAKEL